MSVAPDGTERGSVAAEFAVVVPAVILVLASCIVALQLVGLQLRLQDAAAAAARTVARGESVGSAAQRVGALVPGATIARSDRGDLVCVRAVASAGGTIAGLIGAATVGASSCAMAGGE